MNILSLSCGVILAVLFFSLTDATWYTVLKVESGSGISVFSLWNFTGAHCDKPDLLYRNNYIENLSNPCILDINLMFVDSNSNKFQIKHIRAFPDFYLETILSVVPNFVDDWAGSSGAPSSTDHYLISTDNYEYLWINNAETQMYAGAYYNETDPNSPKFVFSYGGKNYSPGMTSSQLVSDRPVKYLEVIVNIQSPCEHLFSEPADDSLCLGPEVYITGINGNTKAVEKGTDTNLTCTIISQLPILGVNWTRDGNVLLDEQNPTKYPGTHMLLIDNFQLHDSGNYTCIAVTVMGNGMSQPIHVQFIGPPMFTIPNDEYEIANTGDITLQCLVHSSPPTTGVFWKKNGIQIDPIINTEYTGSTMNIPSLTITHPNHTHLGIYECCATNSFEVSTTSCSQETIMITGAPYVEVLNPRYEYQHGSSVTLNCNFTSYPAAFDVFWEHNGNRMNIPISHDNFTGSPELSINSMAINHRGFYECCVENHLNLTCHHINLGAKPLVTVPQTHVIITRNNNGTLPCNVDSFPGVDQISWNITLSDTIVVHTGADTQKYNLNGSSLNMISASFDDAGYYVCVAENEFGFNNSEPVVLSVYGVFVEAPHTLYSVLYGDSVLLNCTIRFAPDLTDVTWTHFGTASVTVIVVNPGTGKYTGSTELVPHLTINNGVHGDGGTYTCKARNAYEESESQNITLEVNGAVPTVSVTQTNIMINSSKSLTLHCSASAVPAVTHVKWYKDVGGTVTVTSTSPVAPSLTFASIKPSDKGNYKCSAFNAVGQTNSSVIMVDVNEVVQMCPCSCDYKQRLDYWATQVVPNYTTDEWREVLAPVTAEIRKNLTVDKTNLSSTIRALTSASDERTSSKSIGLLGIVLLSLTLGAFVTMDITSIKRHLTAMKEYLHHDKVIEEAQ